MSVWQEILAKLCMKNYENRPIFVIVTARKSMAPFLFGRDLVYAFICNFYNVFK